MASPRTWGLPMATAVTQWSAEDVGQRLRKIIGHVHDTVSPEMEVYGRPGDDFAGANIAGFLKVAHATDESPI